MGLASAAAVCRDPSPIGFPLPCCSPAGSFPFPRGSHQGQATVAEEVPIWSEGWASEGSSSQGF